METLTRPQLIARAIEEDSNELISSILRGSSDRVLVNVVRTLHESDEFQPDPAYITAVVTQAITQLTQHGLLRHVQRFQAVLMLALDNNPGFTI